MFNFNSNPLQSKRPARKEWAREIWASSSPLTSGDPADEFVTESCDTLKNQIFTSTSLAVEWRNGFECFKIMLCSICVIDRSVIALQTQGHGHLEQQQTSTAQSENTERKSKVIRLSDADTDVVVFNFIFVFYFVLAFIGVLKKQFVLCVHFYSSTSWLLVSIMIKCLLDILRPIGVENKLSLCACYECWDSFVVDSCPVILIEVEDCPRHEPAVMMDLEDSVATMQIKVKPYLTLWLPNPCIKMTFSTRVFRITRVTLL